jgi:hypothetical protein
MPRKPRDDDNIVRLLSGKGRPSPPSKLSRSEQAIWRAIVDSSPDRFIDGAGQLVLRRVIAQLTIAERHEERLRRIAAAGGDLEAEIEIAKAHRATTKAILDGLTALRATPRSRMASRDARNAFARSLPGPKPWERLDIDGEAVEPEAVEPEVVESERPGPEGSA